ncbi:MAG: glycosyltransferase family 4 protein [Elusimicrobiota bacterium]|jgi:glycosyltransferase involved in cell wall biosynthesis
MKVAFVRGPFLNPWELQSYVPVAAKHPFSAIGAHWQFYTQPITLPNISIEKTGVWGETLGKRNPSAAIFYNRALSWTLGRSYGLLNLKKAVGDADILHAAELHSTMTYQCLRLKRKQRTALVLTVWENLLHTGELHPLRHLRKRAVMREADGFLAVTETSARMLREEGVSPDRIAVIPMSVDLQRFVPAPKDPKLAIQLGILPDDYVVLFIGRFVPEKGILDLLECIPSLNRGREAMRLRFLFVGAGPLQPVLEQAQDRYPELIRVHPFVPYEDISALHNLADVFVLPSRPTPKWQEQFGYVLIESMASGKPVVTTRTGSIPDVAGDAALLVEPGQPKALGEGLAAVIDGKEKLSFLSHKALARAQQLFSAERNAPLIESFYQSALAHSRRRR